MCSFHPNVETRFDPPLLAMIGMDHAHVDVGVRERFQPTTDAIASLYALAARERLGEVVLVATCNRIELYACCPKPVPVLEALIVAWLGPEAGTEFLGESRIRTHRAAVHHLMRVSSGLDSQVIGDIHILGQIKRCFQAAERAGSVGPMLQRVFSRVFRAGKRVRSETKLMAGRASFGARAAAAAQRWASDLTDRPCVVVGCGKTGANTVRALVARRASRIFVTNRTAERAEALAAELPGVVAFPYAALAGHVAAADIIITATGAPRPVVHVGNVQAAERERLFIDLSLPRNIEPGIAVLPRVTLLDLDAPGFRITEERRDEEAAIASATEVVDAETAVLVEWLETAPVREALRPLERALDEICRKEIGFAAGHEIADRTAHRIVAKFMARPMVALRDTEQGSDAARAMAEVVGQLFRRL